MYNEEIKMIYVTEKGRGNPTAESVLINAFRRSAPYEEKYGKELSLFTPEEIEDMMTGLQFKSDSSARAARTRYAGYTDWAIVHRRAMVNNYKDERFGEQGLSSLVSIQNNGIVSREEVIGWCSKLENPCDRAQLLMLFEGIKGDDYKECINLKEKDLDAENCTVYISSRNKTIKVSRLLMDEMLKSSKSTEYIPATATYRHTISFNPSDLVIKERNNVKAVVSDRRRGRRFSDAVRRTLGYLGISNDITPASIYKSGIVQYIKDGAAKENITPEDYINRHVDEIKDRFDFDIRNTGVVRFCNDYFKGSGE